MDPKEIGLIRAIALLPRQSFTLLELQFFDPSIIIAHNQNPTYNTTIEIHDIDQIYSFTSIQAHKIWYWQKHLT